MYGLSLFWLCQPLHLIHITTCELFHNFCTSSWCFCLFLYTFCGCLSATCLSTYELVTFQKDIDVKECTNIKRVHHIICMIYNIYKYINSLKSYLCKYQQIMMNIYTLNQFWPKAKCIKMPSNRTATCEADPNPRCTTSLVGATRKCGNYPVFIRRNVGKPNKNTKIIQNVWSKPVSVQCTTLNP